MLSIPTPSAVFRHCWHSVNITFDLEISYFRARRNLLKRQKSLRRRKKKIEIDLQKRNIVRTNGVTVTKNTFAVENLAESVEYEGFFVRGELGHGKFRR
jgi:hypothetical protein